MASYRVVAMMTTQRGFLCADFREFSLRASRGRMVLETNIRASLAFTPDSAAQIQKHSASCPSRNSLSRSKASPPGRLQTSSKPHQRDSIIRASRWSLEQAGLGPRQDSGPREDAQEGEGESKGERDSEAAPQVKQPINVVLVCPQIPGNTGSIARTCAATAVPLHLVQPLGFQIDDTRLKRAGLDYWPHVVVKVHDSWPDFFSYFQQQDGPKRLIAFTKRGTTAHNDLRYKAGDWLLFGAETFGLPPDALSECVEGSSHGGGLARIPIDEAYVRSLNLAVSVGVGVYEALRQLTDGTEGSV